MKPDSGYFEYICEFWEDIKEPWEFKKVHGVIYADSWTKAAQKLEEHYDKIENIFIQGIEPYSVYEFESHPVKFHLIVGEKK